MDPWKDRAERTEAAMQAMLDKARETMPDDLLRLRDWAHGVYAQWQRAEAVVVRLRAELKQAQDDAFLFSAGLTEKDIEIAKLAGRNEKPSKGLKTEKD